MKIETDYIPEMTIEEFADKHGLVMEVHERPKNIGASDRYYAHFRRISVVGDGVLSSVFGNGRTPEEAIAAYACQISLQTICDDNVRVEGKDIRIRVPRLVETKVTP